MSKPRRKAEPSWRWHLWVVALTVAIGVLLGQLASAVGADAAAKRVTTRFYGPLLAKFYPRTGQEAITIVSIDDDDLADLEYSWPLGLDYHQRLIDQIVALRPRAIFLDLLFLDRKRPEEIGKLLGAACKASEQDVPVPIFLATVTPPDKRGYTEEQLFHAKNMLGTPCILPVAPHVSPDELDQSQWQYALVPKGQPFPSPALAMFCAQDAARCPADVGVPLAMVWGTAAPEANVRTMVRKVDHPRPGDSRYEALCRQDWQWWLDLPLARWVRTRVGLATLPLCPYHRVLPVRAFQNQGFGEPQRAEALGGKLVLVGTDLQGTGDRHVSPFHGALPGVHVHAMALDNLIAFEGSYKHARDPAWSAVRGKALLFNAIALLATSTAILCFRLLERRAARREAAQPWHSDRGDRAAFVALFPLMVLFGQPRERRRGHAARTVCKIATYLVVAGAVVWIGYALLQQGPLAVVPYVLFPFVADTALRGERIAANLRDYLRAFWSGQPWREWRRSGLRAD